MPKCEVCGCWSPQNLFRHITRKGYKFYCVVHHPPSATRVRNEQGLQVFEPEWSPLPGREWATA